MPFTLSHAAAVLPVSRQLSRWHVLSAAVIGSMVPDFSILLPGSWPRWRTHSLPALLFFCLPMGLLAYWLTQRLIKPGVAEVLPPAQRARLRAQHPSARLADLRAWLAAAAAVLFGAATHLAWDAFTHEDSRAVRMFPVLRDYGPEMGGHPLRLYRWLQHGSSVIGLAAVLIAVTLWYRRAEHVAAPAPGLSAPERRAWIAGYLAAPLVAMLVQLLRLLARGASFLTSSDPLEILAIRGLQATALSLIVVSVLLRLRVRSAPA